MPTPTYTLIDSTVLGTTAASVTFSSITQDYRDLIVVVNVDSDSIGHQLVHGGATANDAAVWAFGDGTSTGSNQATNVYIGSYYQARQVAWQIMDYSATDKYKTILMRGNGAADGVVMVAGSWAFTSAVTSVQVLIQSGLYPVGTSFYLYGVAA